MPLLDYFTRKRLNREEATTKRADMHLLEFVTRKRLNREATSLAADYVKLGASSTLSRFGARFALRYNLTLFRVLHLLLTLVCWQHFFLNKFWAQLNAVPTGAPNYWLKRLVPPVEFGLMHAILFQLALIPLTMSRRLLALLSTDALGTAFPFHHIMQFHVQVGYAFCVFIIGATALFFAFFGKICHDHNRGLDPADLCEKFRTEIFATGLVTFAATSVVLITSYLRGRTTYELFYVAHFAVFLMFFFAAIHTVDIKVRTGKLERSQTLTWFGTSMALYLTDRLWSYATTKRCRVVEVHTTRDGKALVLRLARPPDFKFYGGQYAKLCVSDIDGYWHPFSIGSGNEAPHLTFIVEVKAKGSWTARLASKEIVAKLLSGEATVQVRGPYGYAAAELKGADAVIGVGTGTGIVPMMSLLEERVQTMMLVGKAALAKAKLDRMGQAPANDARAAAAPPLGDELAAKNIQLSYRLRSLISRKTASAYFERLKHNTRHEPLHVLVDVFGWILIVGEVTLIGCACSWSALSPAAKADWQGLTAQAASAALLGCYVLHLLYRLALPERYLRSLWAWVDVLITLAATVLLVIWSLPGCPGTFVAPASVVGGCFIAPTPLQLLVRTALALFRVWRLLQSSPLLRPTWHRAAGTPNTLGAEKYQMIWVCRSADVAAGYLPLLHKIIDDLNQSLYGKPAEPHVWQERLGHFVDYTIYITDKDPAALVSLQQVVAGSLSEGKVLYKRPNLVDLILKEKQRQILHYGLRMSAQSGAAPSFSCNVTFCGSAGVARVCHEGAFASNELAMLLGCAQFVTTFREEYYGFSPGPAEGARRPKKAAVAVKLADSEESYAACCGLGARTPPAWVPPSSA